MVDVADAGRTDLEVVVLKLYFVYEGKLGDTVWGMRKRAHLQWRRTRKVVVLGRLHVKPN